MKKQAITVSWSRMALVASFGAMIAGSTAAFDNLTDEQRAALEAAQAGAAEAEEFVEVSMWDGVYTAAQAATGREVYAANCASCHGPAARGAPGMPSLVGNVLNRKYADMQMSTYFDYMSANMPKGREGSLTSQQYADIMAFILSAHGAPEGEGTITPDRALLDSIILGPRPE